MPLTIIENRASSPAPGSISKEKLLTESADGFLFWLGFAVSAPNSHPTIPAGGATSAMLAFTYDAGTEGIALPSGGAQNTYHFTSSSGSNKTLEIGGAHLECLIRATSPVNRRVTAVFELQTNAAGTMGGWLDTASWTAVPTDAAHEVEWDKTQKLGFKMQKAQFGTTPRFASRVVPVETGGALDELGVIAPLSASPMIQYFYDLVKAVAPGAAAANPVDALSASVENITFSMPAAGCTGFTMIAHGVFAPTTLGPFSWLAWRQPDLKKLAHHLDLVSSRADWQGPTPNDEPQEIIYMAR